MRLLLSLMILLIVTSLARGQGCSGGFAGQQSYPGYYPFGVPQQAPTLLPQYVQAPQSVTPQFYPQPYPGYYGYYQGPRFEIDIYGRRRGQPQVYEASFYCPWCR